MMTWTLHDMLRAHVFSLCFQPTSIGYDLIFSIFIFLSGALSFSTAFLDGVQCKLGLHQSLWIIG